jgi:hypothetical protein
MASGATPPCPDGLEQDAWEQALLMAPELAQLNWEKPKKEEPESDDEELEDWQREMREIAWGAYASARESRKASAEQIAKLKPPPKPADEEAMAAKVLALAALDELPLNDAQARAIAAATRQMLIKDFKKMVALWSSFNNRRARRSCWRRAWSW